jgi:hypothetical protein
MGQFDADMALDWMDIHVYASNNHPSKQFSYLYAIYFLIVINKKIHVCSKEVKNKPQERCPLCVCLFLER